MTEISRNFSQAEQAARTTIATAVAAAGKQFKITTIEIVYPPDSKLGDYSVPCFSFAKAINRHPAELAKQLADLIKPAGIIGKVVATGPYLNFFVDPVRFNQLVLTEITKAKDGYGKAKIGKGKRVMIEYFSPNTNKPLTVGHLRNIFLGASLIELCKALGYKVLTATLYNDRGIAIAKTILGYQRWGENKTPKQAGMKPDHFVGSFYTKFAIQASENPKLDKEAQKVLRAWEKGDKEVTLVWQRLMTWVLDGFSQTLTKIGHDHFDKKYYESEFYHRGKEIVEQGIKQRVFIRDKDGVVVAPLEAYSLADKIVLRPDDTSLYVTQDLYLAHLKEKEKLDQSIYVVANEQDLYFKQLFKILELLGIGSGDSYHHLSYGMVRLPSGRIKSREGLVKGTGADELITILETMAREEIAKRGQTLPEKEVSKRAHQIALAALKFYILAVDPKKTMIFDPQQSLAFNGRTGPYLQYVHARIASLFTKAKIKPTTKINFSLLADPVEHSLINQLARFPSVVSEAATQYSPAILATYLFDLAQAFSLFYETMPILKADAKLKRARLLLVAAVKTVMANGLQLLGIEAPEKM